MKKLLQLIIVALAFSACRRKEIATTKSLYTAD